MDDWEKDFKKWKEKPKDHSYSEYYRQKHNLPKKQEKPEEEIEDPKQEPTIQKIEHKIEKPVEETIEYIKEPKHISILKKVIIILAFCLIAYLLIQNFFISKDFNYFYDIGSAADLKTPYLSPLNRISDADLNSSTRNLTSQLVYFNVDIPRGSDTITIETRLKDNFLNNSIMSLGAKDKQEWHYTYQTLYNKNLKNISDLYRIGDVYLLNKKLELLPLNYLLEQKDIVIATDKEITPTPNIITDYIGNTIINTTLRGGHTFYIYTAGDLDLKVKKQDINWYNNSDELNIYLYDTNETLIANTSIPDDGITDIKNKDSAIIQSGELKTSNLKPGVYKLVFSDFDGLIREIQINTKKIVAERLFLADNELYIIQNKNSRIYTNITRDSQLKLLTYHSNGIQNITYNNNVFNFYKEDEPLYLNLTKSEYLLDIPKNDIIISSIGYMSFSKESYFKPFNQKIISISNNLDWLKNNADYLVTDYTDPLKEDNWIISLNKFDINNTFIKDNKLSLLFNTPHLSQDQNNSVEIDYINITIHKPGLFEKWEWTGK